MTEFEAFCKEHRIAKHCDCGCKIAYYKGLLFIDRATGYVTQAAECANCGKLGQIPAMFSPDILWRFPNHPSYIEIDSSRWVNGKPLIIHDNNNVYADS